MAYVFNRFFRGGFRIFDYAEFPAEFYHTLNEFCADAREHTEKNDNNRHHHTAQKPDYRKYVKGYHVYVDYLSRAHKQTGVIGYEREYTDQNERELVEYIRCDRKRGSDPAVHAVFGKVVDFKGLTADRKRGYVVVIKTYDRGFYAGFEVPPFGGFFAHYGKFYAFKKEAKEQRAYRKH